MFSSFNISPLFSFPTTFSLFFFLHFFFSFFSFIHSVSHLLSFSFLTSLNLSPSSFLCVLSSQSLLSSFVTHFLHHHHTSFPSTHYHRHSHSGHCQPLLRPTNTTILFSLFFVVQVSLECKNLFLAYGFALIWFFFNGSWSFMLIFALFLFWLEIGRESSYLDLAS